MKNIKYTIFDIDGTILPGNASLSKNMLDVIHGLIAKGILVGIATGRNFHFASEVADQINGKFYLAINNGAVIFQYPSKKIVSETYLTSQDAEIVRKLLQEKRHPCILNGTIHFKERTFIFNDPPLRQPIINFIENQKKEFFSFDTVFETKEFFFSCLYSAVPSSMIETEIAAFRMKFPNLNFTSIADPVCIGFHWLGLMPANTGKENLLKHFKKHYQAKNNQILAAGDDMNDIGMLQEAGLSIAMGTAPELVKRAADLCIGTAQDESLCKYLRHHFLS
mgnify:CR=1 FL=1